MATQATLRHVDPRLPRGPLYRAYVRLASSRPATWLATKPVWALTWKLDRCSSWREEIGLRVRPLVEELDLTRSGG